MNYQDRQTTRPKHSAAVKEFRLKYHDADAILSTICPCHGNSNPVGGPSRVEPGLTLSQKLANLAWTRGREVDVWPSSSPIT